jgi:hypothetical protein
MRLDRTSRNSENLRNPLVRLACHNRLRHKSFSWRQTPIVRRGSAGAADVGGTGAQRRLGCRCLIDVATRRLVVVETHVAIVDGACKRRVNATNFCVVLRMTTRLPFDTIS